MLHAFSFRNGEVSYRNRFLRSSQYWARKNEGRIKFSELGTDPALDPCRQTFLRCLVAAGSGPCRMRT
jgi:beta-carotene 15,15'-monooxygenase